MPTYMTNPEENGTESNGGMQQSQQQMSLLYLPVAFVVTPRNQEAKDIFVPPPPPTKYISVDLLWYPSFVLCCCLNDNRITVEDWVQSFLNEQAPPESFGALLNPSDRRTNTAVELTLQIGNKRIVRTLNGSQDASRQTQKATFSI
eukprot:scaffold17879_cov49-Cylindrotheca_fusiformis.AAC.1